MTLFLPSLGFDQEQQILLDTIRSGSTIAWRHINMHGEYDFSSEKLADSLGLTNPKLIDLHHLGIWEGEKGTKD